MSSSAVEDLGQYTAYTLTESPVHTEPLHQPLQYDPIFLLNLPKQDS